MKLSILGVVGVVSLSVLAGCVADDNRTATEEDDLPSGPPALVVATAFNGPALIESYKSSSTSRTSTTSTNTVTYRRNPDPIYIEVNNFPVAGWFKIKPKSRNPKADFTSAYRFAPTGFVKDSSAAWAAHAWDVYKDNKQVKPADPRKGAKHVASLLLNDADMDAYGIRPGDDVEIGVFDHRDQLVKSFDTFIGTDPWKIPGASVRLAEDSVVAYNSCVTYSSGGTSRQIYQRELGPLVTETTTVTTSTTIETYHKGWMRLEEDVTAVPIVSQGGMKDIVATYATDGDLPVLDPAGIKVSAAPGGFRLTFDHATEPTALIDVTNLITEKTYGPIEQKGVGSIDVGETRDGDILVLRVSERVRVDETGKKFAPYYTLRGVVRAGGLELPTPPRRLPDVSAPQIPEFWARNNATWAASLGETMECPWCPSRLESIEYWKFKSRLREFQDHPEWCKK